MNNTPSTESRAEPSTDSSTESTVRAILRDHARLKADAQTLDAGADLYEAGMTSHASVNVMLALEGAFGIEFPDHMLKRNVFSTIASISRSVGELVTA